MADLLQTYLQNHLAAARAGVDLFRRATANHRSQPFADELAALTGEVEEDQTALLRLAKAAGAHEHLVMSAMTRVGERVGRLKPNGSLLRRTPLTSVMEIEALQDAVSAKSGGWEALAVAAGQDKRLDAVTLASLRGRAVDQLERLSVLHRKVATDAFTA